MSTDPKRVKEVFLEAAELSDEAVRAAFLARACGGDAGLRERVEVLLRSHDPDGSFLGTPAAVIPDPDHTGTRTFSSTPELESQNPAEAGVPLGFLSPSTRPDSLGRIGHYEVLQVLGKGGFGIVFRAFDDMLQRVVAIKVMAPQIATASPARKRFLREARSSAQVRHENVVQVYEIAEQPLPYLVVEFIPGETLQQKLDRNGPLEVPEILRIGRQIAEGLAAAHACDLIHRDIKPGNILLEGGSHKAKITDFGLARAADDASISQSGIIAGTPMFMAPEQALGHKIDRRADLFSLGSVLYQMASGRPPFRAPSALAVLKRVAEEPPRPIPEIIPETPDWLCGIIAKLHAKNPDDRFQSAREVADLLADCEARLKAKREVKNILPAARKPARRTWGAATAVLLLPPIALAVMEFAGVTHLFRQRATTDPTEPGVSTTPAVGAKQETPVPAAKQELQPTFKNSIGMEFVIVPKGKSWLGGGNGKLGDKEVAIPADFYLGKYPVTQEEWEKVMGDNPSWFSRTGRFKDLVKDISDADLKRFPVECVSWDQCQLFAEKLNTLENETGWVYRLPTEVEWEYACRGGPMLNRLDSAFDFYFAEPTNTLLLEQANCSPNGLGNGGLTRTCKVGSYKPNKLGLYDMHGNVWHWCADLYDPKALGPWDSYRVNRGGSFCDNGLLLQAAFRGKSAPSHRAYCLGLRLIRVPSGAPAPEAKTPSADPDRHAAESVLSLGGTVRVDGDREITALAELPKLPFRLTGAALGYKPVAASALVGFKDCKNLTLLHLSGESVTDEGLAHFNGCTNLTNINMHDNGLVTDAGLAAFKDCKNLMVLDLSNAGKVGDAGLAHFKDRKNLQVVILYGTRVTDAGLAHLKECKNLTEINLNGLQVTDAGLAHLAGLNALELLDLGGTKVTAKGVDGLAKALPKCKITWNSGTIEPKPDVPAADADRKAAEYALSIGGEIKVNEQGPAIKAATDLPREAFRLTWVGLPNNKQVTDAGLAAFKDCKNLGGLQLGGTPVTDAGLIHLKDCTNLTGLDLNDTKVTDAGLVHLKDCTNLTYLQLGGTQTTDAGLVHFKDCKKLMHLNLGRTPVGDAGLAQLKDAKDLTTLYLDGTPITDTGLTHLTGLDKLIELKLAKTKVTAKGAETLAKALPKCKITWDGGTIEPK